jgi:hypothetical protein
MYTRTSYIAGLGCKEAPVSGVQITSKDETARANDDDEGLQVVQDRRLLLVVARSKGQIVLSWGAE